MRNRLWAANLRSRCAIPREVHKEEHIKERLVFAMGNDDQDWKKVIFSDDVSFFYYKGRTSLLYIILLSPDPTTDTPPFVPEVVEYLCRVGVDFSSWNGHNLSNSREIQPAEINNVCWNAIWFFRQGYFNLKESFNFSRIIIYFHTSKLIRDWFSRRQDI